MQKLQNTERQILENWLKFLTKILLCFKFECITNFNIRIRRVILQDWQDT